MRIALKNMWPALQASCRVTAQAIIKEHNGAALQVLGVPEMFGEAVVAEVTRSSIPSEDAVQQVVTLAHINDCLHCIAMPIVPYIKAGGLLPHLDTAPLIPFVRPAANYYARFLAPYHRFTALTKRDFAAMFWAYALDGGMFGLQNGDTTFTGLRVSSLASYLCRDKSNLTQLSTGILLPLFDKSAAIAGTAAEAAEARETLSRYLDFAEDRCECLINKLPEPSPGSVPSPPRTDVPQRRVTKPLILPEPAVPPSPQESPKLESRPKPHTHGIPPPQVVSPNVEPSALDKAGAELRGIIGLTGVKEEVDRLVNYLKIQTERRRHGLRESNQSLHFVFTGNPGTGKTTVARILAKMLHGFGLLKTANVVECDRSSLVGSYLGQTAVKTDEVIRSALDGVLFIDEAYALAGDAAKYGHGDMYGDEAINTLLKRMEDFRDRLVVIAAGYPGRMENFLRTNPGLESRFTRFIRFEDYRIPDLCRIFEKFCTDAEYTLTTLARAQVFCVNAAAYLWRDGRFGNGRFVRNLYERTVSRHADRLAAAASKPEKADLVTIAALDIPPEWPPHFDPSEMDLGESVWVGGCPGCKRTSRCGLKFLGQVVNCKCGGRFVFPWWNPVATSLKGVPADWITEPTEGDLFGQSV